MANQAKQDVGAARKANKLYWGSDISVNQIAEKLDLSKGRLYGLLVPLPTGDTCPDCGEETGYANRTARDRHQAMCSFCADGTQAGGAKATTRPTVTSSKAPTRRSMSGFKSQALLGAALLGVAAGLFFAAHRRR
ncbi:MAG: hypothetical protein BMS9Abin29_0005 [Gemmatimonadota bacterium]|nr:MAG: hypothetical protein BMS9Abin29_0005 [Gemmatimonadota bacterium]